MAGKLEMAEHEAFTVMFVLVEDMAGKKPCAPGARIDSAVLLGKYHVRKGGGPGFKNRVPHKVLRDVLEAR